ncbi:MULTISPECIES: TetR/AcrR family transcriptional regulator [Variovorax]|uniref:TetR/AcrR family transcriptional regulator n=1 Tax=Variovorax TaxID=34072 RepID=UPI00086AF492|nr:MULTISPECIES: TetR/AcrR family transcriptional regulator [Variovorax]MBN8757525.1 TetR/AcrR family transcriptional regulator [Variovorax sp.]ODU13637.1 MAG: TetR family transcriptional regulator [Variovorax sp. SCN 67-85]ODV20939.1 MAG: TetR family transcriptional regulator [Variovorax sp. SCN 67-20]OJZ08151.1 MAG: TetR family transcriptional regulator [Variovorax sp. 67-131]UKI05639.1 TetR/AcrR family transcriptional regulator [Variovorax paradoxus]
MPHAPASKPLKRPTQARGKFTVQAIYDAFVRIWNAHGWDGVTTRAVALETGIAVGTLYDYFPDKEALLSGYVRHCIETLLARLDADVIAPAGIGWRERVPRLVRVTCDTQLEGLPAFDHEMLMLEHRVAEPKHHRRVYDELAARWLRAFEACADLQPQPAPATIHALLTACWGARRYRLLVQPGAASDNGAWLAEMEAMVMARLTAR